MRAWPYVIAYLALGVLAAVFGARTKRVSRTDLLLFVLIWPLYAPLFFFGGAATEGSTPFEVEQLRTAIAEVARSSVRSLLPDDQCLQVVQARMNALSFRIAEIGRVLEKEASSGTMPAEDTVARLRQLADKAAAERASLGELCIKLKNHVLLLRFGADFESSELATETADLVAKMEGVNEALSILQERLPPC